MFLRLKNAQTTDMFFLLRCLILQTKPFNILNKKALVHQAILTDELNISIKTILLETYFHLDT